MSVQKEFRGPLPPPEVLGQYEAIHPGTAEIILRQFERETQHRHAIEQKIVDAELASQVAEIPALRLGQIFAFCIAIFGLVCSTYGVVHAQTAGQAWAAASIAGLSLGTLAGVFIYGRKSKPEAQAPREESSSDPDARQD